MLRQEMPTCNSRCVKVYGRSGVASKPILTLCCLLLLKGAELAGFAQRLQAALQPAAAGEWQTHTCAELEPAQGSRLLHVPAAGLQVSISMPEEGRGHVMLTLACEPGDAQVTDAGCCRAGALNGCVAQR
jgi:hypothetical protein